MNQTERKNIPNFLCDTWWYGITRRMGSDDFDKLARLRSQQGFNAVQLVVGIPPEVGPENPNAESQVGLAWSLDGEFNDKYLDYSRERIQQLNSHGLTVIIYGAWGQQIEWLGVERMKDWWKQIVDKCDDLDVIYCLTGESDIWIGSEKKLLPNKTTGELKTVHPTSFLPSRLTYMGKRLIETWNKSLNKQRRKKRHEKWSDVLSLVSSITTRPIFIHTLPNMTSQEVVNNPELLDAVTVQTGHDAGTRKILWQLPISSSRDHPSKPFINLEPWYEGIGGQFDKEDQLYAYWASMMASAHAFCYGAHGVWNVGDGKFLSHWGKQTLKDAMRLDTPQLIGTSHNLFISSNFAGYRKVEVEDRSGELVKITRFDDNDAFVCYVPDISLVDSMPKGNIFLPLEGKFSKILPEDGQVVIVSS